MDAFSRIAIKGVAEGNSDAVSESRPATPRESKICEDVAKSLNSQRLSL